MSVLLTCAVLLTWLAILSLAFGIGAMLLRAVADLEHTWADALATVLVGIAALFGVLLLWHFVWPVDEVLLVLCGLTGTVGCIRERQWVRRLAAGPHSSLHLVPIIAFSVWAANHVLTSGAWDDYLYEYQTVRWFHQYSIVPGLANLHGRFGFNASHHLYAALLSAGPWAGVVHLLVNGPFLLLVVARSWTACAELIRGRFSIVNVFAACFLAPCVVRFIDVTDPAQPGAATLKGDVLSGALAMLAACYWLECSRASDEPRRGTLAAVTTLLTAALLIALRVVSVPFAAALILGVGLVAWRRQERRRPLAVAAVLSAILILAPPIRGVVLSGYPFYPSSLLGAPVDWRVPRAQADMERTFITTYAQGRSVNTVDVPDERWVVNWLRDLPLLNRVTLATPALIALSIVPLFLRRKRGDDREVPPWAWIVLWGGTAGTLALWMNAPAVRFVWGYVWICFASLIAWTCTRQGGRALVGWPVSVGAVLVLLITTVWRLPATEIASHSSPLVFATLWAMAYVAAVPSRLVLTALLGLLAAYPIADRVSASLVYGRGRDAMATVWLNTSELPRAAPPAFTPRVTDSGLTVNVTRPQATYDTPLPSTPYFNRYLQLRDGHSLLAGFKNPRQDGYPQFGYRPGIRMSVPDE